MARRREGTRKPAAAKPGAVPRPRRKGSAGESPAPAAKPQPEEIGGPPGADPTRYGDWQFKGRVTDF